MHPAVDLIHRVGAFLGLAAMLALFILCIITPETLS